MKNIGGFFVINTLTNRIIKEHKHYKTALTMRNKLGADTHTIKPIADREAFMAQLKAVVYFSQTS